MHVTYQQRVGAGGAFVANTFNLVDDVASAPTNLSAALRDADSNGSADTVRLTFNAGRTGLQTTGGATVRRYPVTSGVVGTTPTDIVANWAYTSGTTGQIDLSGVNFPAAGSYVYQVRLKSVVGTSFGPYSGQSNTVSVSSTGLGTVASPPVAVSITKTEGGSTGVLSNGDAIVVTFNEPIQLTSGTRFIEIQDTGGDRARLQSAPTANATFTVGGADGNVLTIKVTGAPISTAGGGTVALAAGTFVHSVSTTFRDRQPGPLPWDPTPSNTLGAGGAPLGVVNVPSSTPTVPFTPTAAAPGRITFNPVTKVVTGEAGAAVPGAVVFVSQVGGTGGTAADAVTATRKQAVANASGGFAITLTSATAATTVRVSQEVPRAAVTRLTSAASASIAAQPTLLATSALGGDDGQVGNGDTIVLRFSEAMTSTDTSFDVGVTRDDPSVVAIVQAGTTNVVAAIITTGRQCNDHASTAISFLGSSGVWSDANRTLTITLANQAGGNAATGITAQTSSYLAGPFLLDANGVAIDGTPVTGASSRF